MHFKQESISDKRYRRPNTFNCVLVDHMFHVFTYCGRRGRCRENDEIYYYLGFFNAWFNSNILIGIVKLYSFKKLTYISHDSRFWAISLGLLCVDSYRG